MQAATDSAGPGHGQIAVRVGRLLMHINDREALDSFLDAWQQAADLGDQAFGVVLPPRRTGRGPADTRGRGCTRAPGHVRGLERSAGTALARRPGDGTDADPSVPVPR